MLHAGEIPLERGKQRRLGAALQHLAQERAAGSEHLAREIGGRLRQRLLPG